MIGHHLDCLLTHSASLALFTSHMLDCSDSGWWELITISDLFWSIKISTWLYSSSSENDFFLSHSFTYFSAWLRYLKCAKYFDLSYHSNLLPVRYTEKALSNERLKTFCRLRFNDSNMVSDFFLWKNISSLLISHESPSFFAYKAAKESRSQQGSTTSLPSIVQTLFVSHALSLALLY